MNDSTYEVLSIEPMEPAPDLDHRNRLNLLTLNNLASFIHSPSVTSIDTLTPKEEDCSSGNSYALYKASNLLLER